MRIYKLFNKNRKLKDLSKFIGGVPVIFGNSTDNFGVEIKPEDYREFINSISKHLQDAKIKQHIMTDFKFIKLMNQTEELKIYIKDVTFHNDEQLQDDEIIVELKSALWREDSKQIIELVKEAIENGLKIQSVTAFLETENRNQERIGIFSNGTIAIENSSTLRSEDLRIIDFLVKGPRAI